MSKLIRGFGTNDVSFSRNSLGSKRIARVPSLHGRRSLSGTYTVSNGDTGTWRRKGEPPE